VTITGPASGYSTARVEAASPRPMGEFIGNAPSRRGQRAIWTGLHARAERGTLTYHGWGHGSYSTSGCVRQIVDSYLLDGVVPARGASCPAVDV
jgi:hypothetical protein